MAREPPMISLHRANERKRSQDSWFTFDPGSDGFGGLVMLTEELLPPGAHLPGCIRRGTEIVTYVREGTLSYEDSTGLSGLVFAGEFQRLTAVVGLRYSEANASRARAAQVFRIELGPSSSSVEPNRERRRFCAADRRGVLCVIASRDGRRGSLQIGLDTVVYASLLDPGQHVVHELGQDRIAWVHVIDGEARFGDLVLRTGDGAGFTGERSVSFTAQKETELLLVDLASGESRRRFG